MTSTYIHHIETLVPDYSYNQDYARDKMTDWLPGKRNRRMIRGIYNHSGITTRYSVLPDFVPNQSAVLFVEDENGEIIEPTTLDRNRFFRENSQKMVVEVGANALAAVDGFSEGDITHVITVSCSGFYNPGPDLDLVHGLKLEEGVERYNLGFMGCYGAFPALRMADQFCKANNDAVVLIVCLELCSIHLQIKEDTDNLLANSLFADGAAAVIVSARTPSSSLSSFLLDRFITTLAIEGENDMVWEIGNTGFDIRLSAYVPRIIGANINDIITRILKSSSMTFDDIGTWAVHPGGRAILDRIEEALSLDADRLNASRTVLRDFGNMSSVTILFILKNILNQSTHESSAVCAMAFGPGLTIETALLKYIPAEQAILNGESINV